MDYGIGNQDWKLRFVLKHKLIQTPNKKYS